MRWIEICNYIFYVLSLATVIGGIFTVLWLICRKCLGNAHTRLLDCSLRLGMQSYWLSMILFAVLLHNRSGLLNADENGLVTSELFLISPAMQLVISVLVTLWMFAVAVTVIYWIAREFQIKQMLAGSVPEDDDRVLACYERMKQRLGIRSEIPLMRNDLFEIPFTVGIIHRKVVLPFCQYTEKELEVIFAHELTHCKHYDLFFKLESILLNVLHAVNPLAYLIRHYITEYTEMNCDICACQVAGGLFSAQEYYTVVLALSSDKKEPMVLLSALYVKTAALERRLCAMIAYQERKRKSRSFAVGVVAVYVLGGALVSLGICRECLVLQKRYYKETRLLRAEIRETMDERSIPHELVHNDNIVIMNWIEDVTQNTMCPIVWSVPAKTKYMTTPFRLNNVHHITIAMKIPEESEVRIGLRYPDGTEHYVGREVAVNYNFFDLTDGAEYSFFVENLGDTEIHVEGGFLCSDE